MVTLDKLALAFELWEKDFRANPDQYLTSEETASLGVSQVSADRAAYFAELLEQV